MRKPIVKYEHERLSIGEQGFTQNHWEAFVRLNQLNEGKYFSIEHRGLRFKQFVGVVQVDGCTVEINPKADKSDSNDKWQNVLIPMLKACGKIKVHTSADAHLNQQNLNLLEIYFEQYLSEVQSLIRRGLVKQYRKESGNVKALKGKINFDENIRHNLIHRERFHTTHQVYDLDHKIHQVLSYATSIVYQFSSSMWISDKCRRVQMHFPEVSNVHVNAQLLDSIQLNRKTASYERALELARLIILNFSPNIAAGDEKMISILFDMNQLWEEYILRKLKQNRTSTIHVLGKRVKAFWGSNRLEPDIVLEKEGKTYIIDTKWKTPGTITSMNDLRQMYAYGRFWNAEKIMLLYPGDMGTTQFIEFENDDFHYPIKESPEYTRMRHKCMKGVVSVLTTNMEGKSVLDEKVGEKVLEIFGMKDK